MEISDNDLHLIQVMKRYFEVKAEVSALRVQLEAARTAAGGAISAFYDPRSNLIYAHDILRQHALKSELRKLMDLAEIWSRGRVIVTSADEEGAMVGAVDKALQFWSE